MMTEQNGKPAPAKDENGRFLPGNNGGTGRPKGSRNKLGEAFIADVLDAWQEHGQAAILEMRHDSPTAFVRMVAQILPKVIQVDDVRDLSDEELYRRIAELSEFIDYAREHAGSGEGEIDAPGGSPPQRKPH